MSSAGSEPTGDLPPFEESESRRTRLDYDAGGVPIYVAVLWVVFLVSYVVYMLIYGLPDLTAWGLP
jgi:hypothetical protein